MEKWTTLGTWKLNSYSVYVGTEDGNSSNEWDVEYRTRLIAPSGKPHAVSTHKSWDAAQAFHTKYVRRHRDAVVEVRRTRVTPQLMLDLGRI